MCGLGFLFFGISCINTLPIRHYFGASSDFEVLLYIGKYPLSVMNTKIYLTNTRSCVILYCQMNERGKDIYYGNKNRS